MVGVSLCVRPTGVCGGRLVLVELVSEHVHRALAYLRLLNDNGVDPLRSRLEAFALDRGPRDVEYQASVFSDSFARLCRCRREKFAMPSRSSTYLCRMGWADLSNDRLHLTDLGRVVLFGLGQEGPLTPAGPDVADVVLEPTDPLAWVSLTRVVAAAGAGMLVDAYFKPDFVPWLVESATCADLFQAPQGQA